MSNNHCECNPGFLSTDSIKYDGPNTPCVNVRTCDTMTVAIQKIDEKICQISESSFFLTTLGTNGPATYINGVLNIPQYTSFPGTVTYVNSLNITSSGTDISSSVADPTTTPTITLNIPTASSTARGVLSASDWTTFNNKENAIAAGLISQYWRGDKTWQTLDTSVVPENSNLYFTNARSRNALSFSAGSGNYDSLTGVITIPTDNNQIANSAGYITTISGITAGGDLNGTYPNPTLKNASVTGQLISGVNITGGTILGTDSILIAFGKLQNQINGLIGGSIYQGLWNASTNTPTITSSVGTQGHYYIVSVAGSTNIDGITDWQIGDWIIFNGSTWGKVDNTDAVISVNGQTGIVSLTTSHISEGTNLYFTNARSRSALSFVAGSGAYNSSTGQITIPTDNSQITNGAGYITSAALSNYVTLTTDQTIGGVKTFTNNIVVNQATVGLGAGNVVQNIAFGLLALNANTSGSANTALGYLSMFQNTTGYDNTMVGRSTATSLTVGYRNTGVGSNALSGLIDGYDNTALGANTLGGNAGSRYGNTAVGSYALNGSSSASSPIFNTAVGYFAISGNSTGKENTAIGANAMWGNQTGDGNVAIGFEAGRYGNPAPGTVNNIASTNSVYIGWGTRSASSSSTNQIVIGYAVESNGDNTVTIGNSSITDNYFSGNIRGGAFIKSGGTSSQFLKADGSVDNNTYATTSSISGTTNYIPKFTSAGSIGNSVIFNNGANVGVATPSPSYRLSVAPATSYTAINTGDGFQIDGDWVIGTAQNTIYSINPAIGSVIQARSGTSAGILNLNPYGGGVNVGGTLSGTSLSMSGGGSFGNAPYSIGQLNVSSGVAKTSTSQNVIAFLGSSDASNPLGLSVQHETRSGTQIINLIGTQQGLSGQPININESMYVKFNGNTLIKTTTDNGTDALQVAGSGLFTGDLRSNGIYRDYQGEALMETNTSAVTKFGSGGAAVGRELQFLAGNTTRLTISASGAAIFSSTLQLKDILTINSSAYSTTYPTSIGANTSAVGYVQLGNNSDNYIIGGSTGTGGNLKFYVNNTSILPTAPNGTLALTIASTGAATFSSSVTVGGALSFSPSSSKIVSGVTDFAIRNNADNTSMLHFNNSTLAATFSGSVYGVGFKYAYNAVSSNYTLTDNDDYINVTSSCTITLPTAVGRSGKRYVIKCVGSVTATIASTSSQTIDGNAASTYTFGGPNFNIMIVYSDGANWRLEAWQTGI